MQLLAASSHIWPSILLILPLAARESRGGGGWWQDCLVSQEIIYPFFVVVFLSFELKISKQLHKTISFWAIQGKVKGGYSTGVKYYSDTLFPLYFSILRQVYFLAFFYLGTPSFANLPIYIY